MAALLSFGYPARHLNLHSEGVNGHEVAEVWSNQFGKWIYLDATLDLFWYDNASGTPASTLDIHNALVSRLGQVETWQRPFAFVQKAESYLRDLPIAAAETDEPLPLTQDLRDWVVSTSAQLRIVPRNDVFTHPGPLPVSQGFEIWCWDNYLDWADAKIPPLPHFSRHTNRGSDFNWPLNQIRYVAEETTAPGVVKISLEDNMPYLAARLAAIDGGGWKEVERQFQWHLHAGRNILALRGRNDAGVEGMISTLVLEYQP